MNEQQLAAVKQAVEALKEVAARTGPRWALEQGYAGHLEVITALQSIISQDALDKMAEDARTIGLRLDDWDKIGCVNHDCDKCKAVQEPRARLMTYIGKGPYPKPGYTVARTYDECPENQYPDAWEEGEKLYTTPPAAQPAPVQDLPFGVGGGLVAIKTLLGRDPCVHANTAIEMIDAILKEHTAAQPASEEDMKVYRAIADNYRKDLAAAQPAVQEGRDWSLLAATQESLREHMAEIKRLKAAQPAPAQEPVAWMYESVCGNDFAIRHDPPDYAKNIRPLYITPPAAQPAPWVNLTDEEILETLDLIGYDSQAFAQAYSIEAKLKEKNSK